MSHCGKAYCAYKCGHGKAPGSTICVACQEREKNLDAACASSQFAVRLQIAKRIVCYESEQTASEMPVHFIRTYKRPSIPTLHFLVKMKLKNPTYDQYLQSLKESGHFRQVIVGVQGRDH